MATAVTSVASGSFWIRWGRGRGTRYTNRGAEKSGADRYRVTRDACCRTTQHTKQTLSGNAQTEQAATEKYNPRKSGDTILAGSGGVPGGSSRDGLEAEHGPSWDMSSNMQIVKNGNPRGTRNFCFWEEFLGNNGHGFTAGMVRSLVCVLWYLQ